MKAAVELLTRCENRFRRWKNEPADSAPPPSLLSQAEVMPDMAAPYEYVAPLPPDNIVTPSENLENRKQMLQESALEPVDFALERAIGNNDSVYSNFIELILLAKRKVGRIVVKDGIEQDGFATGFMVSERLLLTNWHVFKTKEDVRDSEVDFFYELDIFGRPGQPTTFRLAPGDFFHSSKELDYCFVAVHPLDISGKVPLSSIGWHFLNPATGKLADEGKELLNIIHHPDGDFQQLSIRENRFVKIMPASIWYETDTAPGSSGSPVFNDQWQVVALHHMGIASKNELGEFLDKNGKVIEPVDGKVDLAKIHWLANEGIRISVLLKDIFAAFPNNSFVAGLQQKPAPLKKDEIPASSPVPAVPINANQNNMENPLSNNVRISFPASLVETNGNITIQINNRGGLAGVPALPDIPAKQAPNTLDDALEIKRVELENAMDFSGCEGYLPDFLGVSVPLPKPKKALRKVVAKLKGQDEIELKYHHYSVIHHAVRKMPVISAINVDGDPKKRLDDSKREDVWLRDKRIDFEAQLNEKYYAGSGFDKGHMSRREDANWGDSADLAKKFADLTCMHCNACPQVPKLNRSSNRGLWGKLEMLALEKGASKQEGKFSKISVLNGPVFSDADRVFKGVQIPMDFWKIILWLDDAGKLKATAFKLTQTGLADDIDFDFEALDIDKNLEFQPFQCSIKSLEKLTKIDFSDIRAFDTFDDSIGEESLKINSEKEVIALMEAKGKTKRTI